MKKNGTTENQFKNITQSQNLPKMKKPKCPECGRDMKNSIDSITKKISPYLWEIDCQCKGMKNFRLSIG